MPDLPQQIRLAAGDYFMYGQDCRMRRVGLPGNVCCAVMKLGSGFDVERLRRRIAESPIMDWLARARIFRPLPMLFPPSGALLENRKTFYLSIILKTVWRTTRACCRRWWHNAHCTPRKDRDWRLM
jgi:hypothetical protein